MQNIIELYMLRNTSLLLAASVDQQSNRQNANHRAMH
jgi:hypothetical protein